MTALQSIQRVGVTAKSNSREAIRTARELVEWLRRRGLEVEADAGVQRSAGEESQPAFLPASSYDLVIALGGDGTLLSVARGLRAGVPLLGVNLGNLGFLTEVSRDELYPSLVDVLAGRCTVEERAIFRAELRRVAGATQTYNVFNDVVIAKSALSRIIELTLSVDDQLVVTYRSDGLIVSTPTGSTAYNLSAGGPIVSPQLPVAVLTPICPHTFSLRPLVVPDTSVVEITLETQREEVFLTLDGQEGTTLGYRDAVRVTRDERSVPLVRTQRHGFFDSLRGKLRWGS
ncbi:MAG: NAD(+)/NADH kinase [Thermoanaerobaculia bacterium]